MGKDSPLTPVDRILLTQHSSLLGSSFVAIDSNSIATLHEISTKCPEVAAGIQTVIGSAFSSISFNRNDKHIQLTEAFGHWCQTIFSTLARDALRSMLMFGVCVVVTRAPSSKDEGVGIRALERVSAAANAAKTKGPYETTPMPVVLQLDDPDLSLGYTVVEGLRLWKVSHACISDSVTKDAIVSVVNQPSGPLLTAPLVSILDEYANIVLLENLHLDVALDACSPLQMLQRRHGPSTSAGSTGLDVSNLFFDTESQCIGRRRREEEAEYLIETAKALNREQLRGLDDANPTRRTETGKAVSYPAVREYVINPDLETATHSKSPTAIANMRDLIEARRLLAEHVNGILGVPDKMLGGNSRIAANNDPQTQLFNARLDVLRREVDSLATACWLKMGLASSDPLDMDTVRCIPPQPKCQDTNVIMAVYAAGLLDQETAKNLVREALGLDVCHVATADA